MNEFVLIFRHSENSHANPTAEQLQERMNWLANVAAGNHLGDKGNSLSAINAKTVRPDMVTDGPYTEIKEFVSGYMIVKADTIEEAVEIAKANPLLKAGGNIEVRAVLKPGEKG